MVAIIRPDSSEKRGTALFCEDFRSNAAQLQTLI